jgi:hypothetical protein
MKPPPMLLVKIVHKIALEAKSKGKNVFFASDGSQRMLKTPVTRQHKIMIQPPAKNGGGEPKEYKRCTLRLWGSVVDCWIEVEQ